MVGDGVTSATEEAARQPRTVADSDHANSPEVCGGTFLANVLSYYLDMLPLFPPFP